MPVCVCVFSGESIKVFVRVRPPDPDLETGLDTQPCLEVAMAASLIVHSKPEPKVFTFDHVAGVTTTQEEVFTAVARPIINSCMDGYNGTIFAYGQTGSGKTFTMIGPSNDSDTFTHDLRGIIPRSFEYLFSLISREKQKCGELVDFLCKCSFLEIYNEQVYDLLDPAASTGLHLRENMKHGVYVDGLTEQCVGTAREAYQVLTSGWTNRRVASTSMNRESSRSHAVFTLTMESKKRERKDAVAKIKTSLLNLVDLAGSERQRDTHTVGLRLKEAGSINRSLSALGNVIMALVDIAHGKSRHVHYRDSKLTFLLRDSLGGNAKTFLIANIHPSARCFGESLSTLNFAKRAKMIKNKAVINEDTSGNVLQLQAEVKRLKEALEKYKAIPSIEIENSYGRRSDDEKALCEMKEMLSYSMTCRERTEKEKMSLLERMENLEKLCAKKDKFLQSTKMILKLRETHISNMERAKSSGTSQHTSDAAAKLLQEEVAQLKYKVDHHPDVTKFALENLDLRAELKRLKEVGGGGSQALAKELSRTHQYTLQLERQLRHFLSSQGDPESSLRPATPTKLTSSADHEQMRAKCKQLQEELENVRNTLNSEREAFHLKESQLESTLASTRRANQELERSIEALRLKSSVERATLNDIHMNTIRSMLSPGRRDSARLGSLSATHTSTPLKRADSEPKRSPLSTLALSAPSTPPHPSPHPPPRPSYPESPRVERRDSAVGLLGSPAPPPQGKRFVVSVGVNTEASGGEGGEGGVPEPCELEAIEGVLTDELKMLQETNSSLQREMECVELQLCRATQQNTGMEAQMEEMAQLHKVEREVSQRREQDFVNSIAQLTSQVADLTSTNIALEREVEGVRLQLQSSDKELCGVREELGREREGAQRSALHQMQRVGELEELLSAKVSECERWTETLQRLQDEVETNAEELVFKEHQIRDLQQSVVREREHSSCLEGEIQSLLDKLTVEVERNTQLSAELQRESSEAQALVSSLNANAQLTQQLQELETTLKAQGQAHSKQSSEAETLIAALTKRNTEDKEAIAGLMEQVGDLRASCGLQQAQVSSLQRELEDSSSELSAALLQADELSADMEAVRQQMARQALAHDRELRSKEMERDLVSDELEHMSEQYQQLAAAMEAQGRELDQAKSEAIHQLREASSWEAEAKKLQQNRERRATLIKVHSSLDKNSSVVLEERAMEIENLKEELEQAAGMIESYEQSREDKNREIQQLKEELLGLQQVRCDHELLQATHATLQGRLERLAGEALQREKELRGQVCEVKGQLEQAQSDNRCALVRREEVEGRLEALQLLYDGQCSTIDTLNDQLSRYKSYEEKLFVEKEKLRSQMEAALEEKAKLIKECENLTRENALITGHHNLRQRIQYHAATKMENSKLKEEVIVLQSRLRRKAEQVSLLNSLVADKPEPQRPSRKQQQLSNAHASHTINSKENIDPA